MPLLWHALTRIAHVTQVSFTVCVIPEGWEQATQQLLARVPLGHQQVAVVQGGQERHDSVLAGLSVVPAHCHTVLVHDAARCLAPPELFSQVIDSLSCHRAVIPGLAVTDTIKQVSSSGVVVSTPDRSTLRAIQTPQGFARDVLMAAHTQATGTPTDDAMMVEALGESVHVIAGHALARKVTTAEDLSWAAQAAQAWEPLMDESLLRKA